MAAMAARRPRLTSGAFERGCGARGASTLTLEASQRSWNKMGYSAGLSAACGHHQCPPGAASGPARLDRVPETIEGPWACNIEGPWACNTMCGIDPARMSGLLPPRIPLECINTKPPCRRTTLGRQAAPHGRWPWTPLGLTGLAARINASLPLLFTRISSATLTLRIISVTSVH